jgi:hypothetical protein
MKKLRAWFERFLFSPIHPLLFSIYFVFRLFVFNVHDIPLLNLFRPLLISVLAALLFFSLFYFLVRNRQLAALMTSVLLLMFYSYSLGWDALPISRNYTNALIFALCWGVVTILILFGIGRKKNRSPNPDLIAGINFMAVILLLFPTMKYLRFLISESLPFQPDIRHSVDGSIPSSPPDVYYIILDAYARADYLEDKLGYDNSEFLQSLRDLGFYVADCSQSNYSSTALSLASSLNLDYVQTLSDEFRPENQELLDLFKLLHDNVVREAFSDLGYQTVSFASGFLWAEWRDADVYIAPRYGPVTEFETVLLHSSYANVLDHLNIINYDNFYAEAYRVRTRLVLDSMDDLAKIPGPKFVFIHLIIPHLPFGFDENGNPVAPDRGNHAQGYLAQVKYINKAILQKLKTLIENSETSPIIILQGDHGDYTPKKPADQMKILNAYYLPDRSDALYPSISPVNSFRIVFNSYFGTNFPLLEDVSYYSASKKYDFSVIEKSCP